MAARAGVTSARPRPPPPPPPALPARQPRPGRALTLGLGWQIPLRASRGGRRQRWSRGSRGGPGSRGTPGGPRPPLALAALGRSGRKVLGNRFFLARAPLGFAARVWARGFTGGGLEALRPLALLGRPGPQSLFLPRPPPASGSYGRRQLSRAGGGVQFRAPRDSRALGETAGEAPPLTSCSASPGAPGPHQRCSQVLKASSEPLEVRPTPHPTPHILLLRREVLIENFLFHTRSVLPRLHLIGDSLVEGVTTDPDPSLHFLHITGGASWKPFPRIVRTGRPQFPAE